MNEINKNFNVITGFFIASSNDGKLHNKFKINSSKLFSKTITHI